MPSFPPCPCGRPAVVHIVRPPERASLYLCADARESLAKNLRQLQVDLAEFEVAYEDDEDRAGWEPCEAVSYPDGFVSRAFPCDGWAEPGESECRDCRNDAAAWRVLYDATCTTAD